MRKAPFCKQQLFAQSPSRLHTLLLSQLPTLSPRTQAESGGSTEPPGLRFCKVLKQKLYRAQNLTFRRRIRRAGAGIKLIRNSEMDLNPQF